MTKILIILPLMVLLTAILLMVALIYLRTGSYLYSDENLRQCQHFSVEEAKREVLMRILENNEGWPSTAAAMNAAKQAQVQFIDHEIQQGPDSWFIPWYRPNNDQVKTYFAMLDCGTLITEFATEKEADNTR